MDCAIPPVQKKVASGLEKSYFCGSKMMNTKHVHIIGGGVGGLFTAALLAKEGFRVTVLERSPHLGGGLQSFTRRGVAFDAGMHIVGGLCPGGSLHRICRYLGILDEISYRPVDADCMDEVFCFADGHTYRIPQGREPFAEFFQRTFPGEREAVRRYTDRLFGMAEQVDFFFLRPGSESGPGSDPAFYQSSAQLIADHVRDPRLRSLLAYLSPLCGGEAGHTPAYIFALINYLYVTGQFRFEGPAEQLADALVRRIRQWGGEVLVNAEVTGVGFEDGKVKTLATADGRVFETDAVVSSIHPQSLLKTIDGQLFTKAARNRLAAAPNNYSAYCVYVVLKEGTFPYINHPCYCLDRYEDVWEFGRYVPERWPRSFVYYTPCVRGQGPYARALQVFVFSPFSMCERWAGTTVGRRGAEYEEWKARHTDLILRKLEQRHPGLRACVEAVYDATPLTIRDYFNEPEGALYGLRKDSRDPYAGYLPLRTKVGNFFMTGQNVYLHGCCGAPLTAVMTAEAVMGEKDGIVKKICDE